MAWISGYVRTMIEHVQKTLALCRSSDFDPKSGINETAFKMIFLSFIESIPPPNSTAECYSEFEIIIAGKHRYADIIITWQELETSEDGDVSVHEHACVIELKYTRLGFLRCPPSFPDCKQWSSAYRDQYARRGIDNRISLMKDTIDGEINLSVLDPDQSWKTLSAWTMQKPDMTIESLRVVTSGAMDQGLVYLRGLGCSPHRKMHVFSIVGVANKVLFAESSIFVKRSDPPPDNEKTGKEESDAKDSVVTVPPPASSASIRLVVRKYHRRT